MKALAVLLLGGVAAGAAFVMLEKKSSAATTGTSSPWPTGWTPPPGASSSVLPQNPTALTIGVTQWQQVANAGGTAAGTYKLFQNAKNPATDWAVFFNGTLMQKGTSQNSGLIAQAIGANLIPGALS